MIQKKQAAHKKPLTSNEIPKEKETNSKTTLINLLPLIIENLAHRYPPKREPKINTGIQSQIILPFIPKEKAPIPFQKIPTKIKVYATATEKDKSNKIIIQIVTNNPVPEDRQPLRKPIIKRPNEPIKNLNLIIEKF